jgi:hypothetical protein
MAQKTGPDHLPMDKVSKFLLFNSVNGPEDRTGPLAHGQSFKVFAFNSVNGPEDRTGPLAHGQSFKVFAF